MTAVNRLKTLNVRCELSLLGLDTESSVISLWSDKVMVKRENCVMKSRRIVSKD